jgi:hypothetical protein
MRIIDMAHYWALEMHNKYQSKIHAARRFEQEFGFRLLELCILSSPSVSMEIPLMWLHEAYSLRLSHRRDPEDHTLPWPWIRSDSFAVRHLSFELGNDGITSQWRLYGPAATHFGSILSRFL